MALEDLIQPSIELAETGVPMTEALNFYLGIAKNEYGVNVTETPQYKKLFVNPETGKTYKIGEKYKRPVLAATLRRIAMNGADEIYGGLETGQNLIKDIRAQGGIIDERDLRDYR